LGDADNILTLYSHSMTQLYY